MKIKDILIEAAESDPGDQVAQHFAQVLADELALEPEAVNQGITDEGFRTPSGVPVYAYQDDDQVYYMGVLAPGRPTTLVSTSFARRGQDNIIEVNAPGEGAKYMVTYSDDRKEPASLLAYGANRRMVPIAQARPGQDEYSMVGLALDMLWNRMQHRYTNKETRS